MEAKSGSYPIESRAGEIERLQIQAEAMAFDAGVMLDRIDVGPGWRCVDLGCGPGGICDLLAERIGAAGHVIGLDADPARLAAARRRVANLGLSNVSFVAGNAYDTGLPRDSFDLVHARFLASPGGGIDPLLAEALALTTPGGVIAFEEEDIDTLDCHPPHPAWDRLKRALEEVFTATGGEVRLARRLYRLMRRAGLADVCYQPFLLGVTSQDPMADFLPQTIESVRRVLLARGLIGSAELDEAVAACRRHLGDPETVWTTFLVAQVWGRKPA